MISKMKNWSRKLGGMLKYVRRRDPELAEKIDEISKKEGVPPSKIVETALRRMIDEERSSVGSISGDYHYGFNEFEEEEVVRPKRRKIKKTKAELQEELEKTQSELKVAQEYAQVVKELVGLIKDLAIETTRSKIEEAKNTVELMKEIRAITDYVNEYETKRMLEELKKQKEILEMKKELKSEEWADTFEGLLKNVVPELIKGMLSKKSGGSSSSRSSRVTEE